MPAHPFLPTDTALVTGASSGIGLALAHELDKLGIGEMVLVARRMGELQSLASQLRCQTRIFSCDLSQPSERTDLLKELPHIDILINNAGFGCRSQFGDQTITKWNSMVELHVTTTIELCHHTLPSMRKNKRGFIVNVGSSIGEFSVPSSGLYCATKAFINNFTESLRMEEAPNGIRAMLLAPGPVNTAFFSVSQANRTPPKGALSPQIVAQDTLKALQRGLPRYMPDWKIRLLVTTARHLPRTMCYSFIQQIHHLKNHV